MSAEAAPITSAEFAEAIKDLPLDSLHLKVLETRNSIVHLDYSNEELRPYADGREAVLGAPAGQASGVPDQDCIDAIKENELLIEKLQSYIRLIRAEVESRGCSWTEFQSSEEREAEQAAAKAAASDDSNVVTNGDSHGPTNGAREAAGAGPQGSSHPAWADGTFQTGTIRNGEIRMDGPAEGGGGRLTDEQLRRGLEELMREGEDGDDDEGVHL